MSGKKIVLFDMRVALTFQMEEIMMDGFAFISIEKVDFSSRMVNALRKSRSGNS